ncbi:hypothetical protein CBR_g20379 [Chara braunii]|uniref:Uncharacterized protein n=1 Tax=Chara braunii TaxID=69332 RepID=A0A388JU63_CHABU|nr:hypothetical protein CBR_g20379 [Chara braunii]|eukprot:GBG61346.1 hypothetical protein CBR_g20379 [Chara braunii]
MHMWSCAFQTKRNWAVHEDIHTKKHNQLVSEKAVQLVEITANVRLTEYRRARCGYVLPWQRDEGMLDCPAKLEVEPVRTGTRRGMTEEEIAQQVALITRYPIGDSAPHSADAVFGRRACIFRPYPREDDSDEEPIPEAANDPALRIPREIDETHDDPNDEETRTHTAQRVADLADREMLGGDKDFWRPFGEVATTGDMRDHRVRGSHAGMIQTEARMTTPAPTRRVHAATSSSESCTTIARGEGTINNTCGGGGGSSGGGCSSSSNSNSGGGGGSSGEVDNSGGRGGGASAAAVEEEVAAAEEEIAAAAQMSDVAMQREQVNRAPIFQAQMQRDGEDDAEGGATVKERLMQQFMTEELDPVAARITPGVARGLGMSDSEMGTHFD